MVCAIYFQVGGHWHAAARILLSGLGSASGECSSEIWWNVEIFVPRDDESRRRERQHGVEWRRRTIQPTGGFVVRDVHEALDSISFVRQAPLKGGDKIRHL